MNIAGKFQCFVLLIFFTNELDPSVVSLFHCSQETRQRAAVFTIESIANDFSFSCPLQ